jgi:hypothetical protein
MMIVKCENFGGDHHGDRDNFSDIISHPNIDLGYYEAGDGANHYR